MGRPYARSNLVLVLILNIYKEHGISHYGFVCPIRADIRKKRLSFGNCPKTQGLFLSSFKISIMSKFYNSKHLILTKFTMYSSIKITILTMQSHNTIPKQVKHNISRRKEILSKLKFFMINIDMS